MSGRLALTGPPGRCLSSDPHIQRTSEAAVRSASGTRYCILLKG